jgi:hypothetical protein
MGFPEDPYRYRADEPHVGPSRPISQGDVFAGIPLLGPAQAHPTQAGTWTSKPRTGPNALGMFVTHPCASRNRHTFQLNPVVAIAPVVRCPSNWGPPWDGYHAFCPLPGLRGGEHYVAKLGEVCPVPAAALEGHRLASLNGEALEAFFHRLAMNSLRYPEIPTHFATEALKLMSETDFWEQWLEHRGTGAEQDLAFQSWLSGPFAGQPEEDEHGALVKGPPNPPGEQRRDVLAWNREDVLEELKGELGI